LGEEAAMKGEEEKEEEAIRGEVDLRSLRQKEKEEDQRGQGWDLGNCLRCETEQEVRVMSNGGMEREKVRVRRVAMRMFAIRRVPNRPVRLILRVSVYNDFCVQVRQKSSMGQFCFYLLSYFYFCCCSSILFHIQKSYSGHLS